MPALRLPRRSGTHRIAAIALFRALLSQCRQLQVENLQRDELQNLIRNRFKQARGAEGLRRLRISFEAGYEAIDLLDAAVAGNGESQSRILDLLESAHPRAKQPPPVPAIASKKRNKAEGTASQDVSATTKPKASLFDRPLPLSQLSGKRRIPTLISANTIPMLRIQKPQPPHLSGFINHRIEQRHKRHARRHRLTEELSLAEREDDWDDIIQELGRRERGGMSIGEAMMGGKGVMHGVEPGWSDAIEDEIDVVHAQLDEEATKNRVMAERMQAVVDRETALFEQERDERRAEKARRLLERKNERGKTRAIEEAARQTEGESSALELQST